MFVLVLDHIREAAESEKENARWKASRCRGMKRETLIRVAPSSLRKLAKYVLEYISIERETGYGGDRRGEYLKAIESSAKAIMLDTSKRRLIALKEKP